ncbi:MAG: rod shape-determining protein MreD [Pseudomonadota bacterium]|jgi:rod shape-determining protein MreD
MNGRREDVLLPANRGFIAFSFGVAFLLNLLPWDAHWPVPDFVAMVLVFWSLSQPRLVGIGIGFCFGLLMDVHGAALLGQHALAYSLLAYGAISLHRRLPWFGLAGRMLHLLPLFLLAQACNLIVRMAAGDAFPGLHYFLPSLSAGLLWPLIERMLTAPQRRALERDETRPL